MRNIRKIVLCLSLMLIALVGVILIQSDDVYAGSSYSVTFNYNRSRILDYVPSTYTSKLTTYSSSVAEGNFAQDPGFVSTGLRGYYSYVWQVDGVDVDLSTYPITRNTTFVAKWIPVVYTIEYNFLDVPVSEIKNYKAYDTYSVESPRLDYYKPARSDYRFVDWYSSPDFSVTSKEVYRPAKSIGDKILYARWKPIEYYINYHTDADNTNNPINYNVTDSEYVLTSPVKEGHIFKGWYLDEDLTQRFDVIPAGHSGNIDLYPKWELVEYNVMYILPNGAIQNVAVKHGEKAELPTIKKGLFDIIITDVSRKNITEDTTINISVVNIWYVYLIGLLLIVGIVTLIVIKVNRNKKRVNKLRRVYQSNLRVTSRGRK